MTRLRILSLGAGVQSSTLALMVAKGELPPVDHAIFADTQWEPRAVYDYLAWLTPLLPFPVHVVSIGSIRDAIVSRRNTSVGRYAAIPWFTVNLNGTHGMVRRQCTSEYKLKPIMHKVRELLAKGRRDRIAAGAVEQWIGISTDEATRMKDAKQRYMINRWPLIEKNMSRADCLGWLQDHKFPLPPKSACIGCPFHSQAAWQRMQIEAPEDFADACAMDAQLRQGDARGIRGVEYMHSARVPLAEAVKKKYRMQQVNLFEMECEGMCGL